MDPHPPSRQMVSEQLRSTSGSGRPVRMEVKGNSMYPTLRPGDQVEVEGVHPSDLRLGDLALIDSGEAGWVIHRFFGWRSGHPPTPRTKGDASPRFDPVWTGVRLLGRVRSFERDGRPRRVRRGWSSVPGMVRSLLVLVWAQLRSIRPTGASR